MMGITRSLNTGLFTGKFTQTTTPTYKLLVSTNSTQALSTLNFSETNLLTNDIYTLYTGLATATGYLIKKEII